MPVARAAAGEIATMSAPLSTSSRRSTAIWGVTEINSRPRTTSTRSACSLGSSLTVRRLVRSSSPRRYTTSTRAPTPASSSPTSQSRGEVIGRPSTETRRSPTRMPACSAGDPGATRRTSVTENREASVSTVCGSMPTHGRRIRPKAESSRAIRIARSMGIAKPMPSDPPDFERIELLTPITRPSALTSGPPELPGLIAASVWIMSALSFPS